MNLNTMKLYLQLKVAISIKELPTMDTAETFILKCNTVLLSCSVQQLYSLQPDPGSSVTEFRSQPKNIIFILLSQPDTARFFQIGRLGGKKEKKKNTLHSYTSLIIYCCGWVSGGRIQRCLNSCKSLFYSLKYNLVAGMSWWRCKILYGQVIQTKFEKSF